MAENKSNFSNAEPMPWKNRTLTEEEVLALYKDGEGIAYPFDEPKKLSNDNEYLPVGSGEQTNNDTPFASSSWHGLDN